MSDLPNPGNEAYLGDGLYASFDGWHIRLRAPRSDGRDDWVAMEPAVYREFIRWIAVYPELKTHLEKAP